MWGLNTVRSRSFLGKYPAGLALPPLHETAEMAAAAAAAAAEAAAAAAQGEGGGEGGTEEPAAWPYTASPPHLNCQHLQAIKV